MSPRDPKAIETDEGTVWFEATDDGGTAIGYEAFAIAPHLAALPEEIRAKVVMDGIARQARAFDREAAMASMAVAMDPAVYESWDDHRQFLEAIGFAVEEGDGRATFTRHSTAVRKTTIAITGEGHVTCRFHGRFPEDGMEILSIGCAATGEAWPSALDPVRARVAMALDLEVAFGDMGYDKGAKARAKMAKTKKKEARR